MPPPNPLTAGFWDAAAHRQLVVQRCSCGRYRHYPQLLCPGCHSGDWSWARVSGRGTVYSYTVTHRAFHPAWADRVPFAVATIDLEEGVRMVSDLPPEDTEEVRIGMPVEVFFDRQESVTLPRFRLAR
jgi:uncharacterized OB-fold protein